MSKLLLVVLILVLVAAVAWTWRRVPRAGGAAPKARLAAMVGCAHCGLHVPSGEAVMLDDQPYCSAGHRDAGPRLP